MNEPRAHALNERIHVAGLPAIAEREFVLSRSDAQRTNRHRRQRIGEFAFEHRAFTGDDAVILPYLAIEEGRVNVGEMHLARAFEITAGAVEVLCHDAEIDVLGSENIPRLAERLLYANVGTSISRAVVGNKKKFEFLPWCTAGSKAENRTDLADCNEGTHPG